MTSKMDSLDDRLKMIPEIEKQITIVKKHATGDHDECEFDGEHCSNTPILRVYPGKFSEDQLVKLIESIFEKRYTSASFLDQVARAGCTSLNEAFHSLLVSRRLVVKGKYPFNKSALLLHCVSNLIK